MTFDLSIYNDEFFKWHHEYTREYAINFMNWYIDKYNPMSIIDFGCGLGSFLEAGYNKGLRKLLGYEIGGEFAKKYTNPTIQKFIKYTDCTVPLRLSKYDCVISIETAEHIDPMNTAQFIDNLVNSYADGGTILFTAAPPEQAGCGHINCLPREVWLEKFSKRRFELNQTKLDEMLIKMKEFGVPPYIISNFMVLERI